MAPIKADLHAVTSLLFDREETRSGPTSSIVVLLGNLLKDCLLRLYLTYNVIEYTTKQLIELGINELFS